MFDVVYSNQARKFFKNSNKILINRLLIKIKELKNKPIIRDTKIIEGYKEKLFRVRVGDYRILYEINYDAKTIGIIKIDKRSKVY